MHATKLHAGSYLEPGLMSEGFNYRLEENKWPRGLWEKFYDFAVAEDVLIRVSLVVQSFTESSSMK